MRLRFLVSTPVFYEIVPVYLKALALVAKKRYFFDCGVFWALDQNLGDHIVDQIDDIFDAFFRVHSNSASLYFILRASVPDKNDVPHQVFDTLYLKISLVALD